MKNNITYSSDDGKISREDIDITSEMSEQYFEMEKDPSQMAATVETRNWVFNNLRDYLNIIRNNNKIIGYVFRLPCNATLMNEFITKKIDEATLIAKIKKSKIPKSPDAIYLCASIVKKEFRGKGLATIASVKMISKIINKSKVKPCLFYWEYSKEGGKLDRRIANETGLKLYKRADN
jgi:hypothetical protein